MRGEAVKKWKMINESAHICIGERGPKSYVYKIKERDRNRFTTLN
jgi:hypothetical protein